MLNEWKMENGKLKIENFVCFIVDRKSIKNIIFNFQFSIIILSTGYVECVKNFCGKICRKFSENSSGEKIGRFSKRLLKV